MLLAVDSSVKCCCMFNAPDIDINDIDDADNSNNNNASLADVDNDVVSLLSLMLMTIALMTMLQPVTRCPLPVVCCPSAAGRLSLLARHRGRWMFVV